MSFPSGLHRPRFVRFLDTLPVGFVPSFSGKPGALRLLLKAVAGSNVGVDCFHGAGTFHFVLFALFEALVWLRARRSSWLVLVNAASR